MIKLESDESIQITLRRHWIVLIVELAVAGVLILGGIFGYFFLHGLSISELGGTSPQIFLVSETGSFIDFFERFKTFLPVFLIIYLMILWSFIFSSLVDYYLDVWVVTNKRIIDVEQKGLFNREVSEFPLTRIQDITVNVSGIFATVFNYGNIHVQTAGEHREFVFKEVPHPYQCKDLILKLAHFTPETKQTDQSNS